MHVYKSTSSFRIFLHVIFALIFFEVKRNFAASFCVELTNNIQHSWKFRVSSCMKIFPDSEGKLQRSWLESENNDYFSPNQIEVAISAAKS